MSSWLPSLNALRAFEAVSRHLSYSAAAEELGVTPAAVKQLVQKLEQSLNVSLLERRGRGIALTKTGMAGLADLAAGFRQISKSVEKIRRIDERCSLTVTAEPSFAISWLVERLAAFKRKHPDIDVLIDSSPRVVDLAREDVDIAIRYGARHGSDVEVYRLFDDETLAVCSPALAAGPPGVKHPHDLQNVPLIHMDISGMEWISAVYRHLFDWQGWLEEVGFTDVATDQGLRFTDYNLAIQAAIAGQGVALGSWPVVKTAIEAGLLVSPFEERARTHVGYDLVVPKSTAAKPEITAFVEWILGEIESAKT